MVLKVFCKDGSFPTVRCPICGGVSFDEIELDSERFTYTCENCGRTQEFNQQLILAHEDD